MKIVIVGAGEVGYDLATLLAGEKHDVTILDNRAEAVSYCSSTLDVLGKVGNATSLTDLVDAGVGDADIVVAATSIDEVNMMATMISKRLGAKMVIARVRNDEYSRPDTPLKASDLGIDVMIHPEESAALEIVQLLKRAAATDVINLAEERIQLIGIRLDKTSPLIGVDLITYAQKYVTIPFRVVAIHRGGITIIPFGKERFRANDQIFVVAETDHIQEIVRSTGHNEHPIGRIMIAGGSYVGHTVAKLLYKESDRWQIKIIEPDLERAQDMAESLKNALVLHGNPTDPNLLATEGIAEMDAFIAVTDDEESNIISCLMAKHLDVLKTVALVSKADYIPLSQTIGLDAAVNKKLAASNEIHRHVWGTRVLSATALHGIKAEVLEFQANASSKILGKPIHKIKFPPGCVVGGIIRNGDVEIATGISQIFEGDRVLIFSLPQSISSISEYF